MRTQPKLASVPDAISRVLAAARQFNLANALSSLNVGSGPFGYNREHEVGNRSRYDDINDRQPGTRITM